jgi:hypothetical protein
LNIIQTKNVVHVVQFVVKDTYKTNPIHGDIQFNIKQYFSNSHTNSLCSPLLKLFEGINGTMGIVHEIVVNVI